MYCIETLKNGLRVLVREMPLKDSLALGIWVKVGGRYESASLSGIAHFTEHLLFKGTSKRSAREIKEAIEGRGGVFNAFTGEESTCYFVKILKKHFSLALDVLSDMVRNSLFAGKDIERERTVILEEIKMYQDQPSQLVHERLNELLWPDQSLGRFIAGTVKSVSRIRRDDFLKFGAKYYHPKNMLVTVCGPLTAREILPEIEKAFEPARKGSESRFPGADSAQTKPRFDFYGKDTEQMHVAMGFHGPSRLSDERYPFSLLNIILGGNMSSRLFEEVREKRGLAYEIRSSLCFFQDIGAFVVSEGVEKEKLPLSLQIIAKELRKICEKPVREEELRRAKDYYLGQLCFALEDTLDHMLWLGEKALYTGRVLERDQIEAEIKKITPEDIRRVAAKYFRANNFSLAVVGKVGEKDQTRIRKDLSL